MSYRHEQISRYTYKIVEDDPYKQYPFLYAIMGLDKCVIIDTGTGAGDFQAYVDRNINTKGLPYLVINTHVHFDHVGGNHRFQGQKGFKGVHMSGANMTFSKNIDINSLCLAHNCTVKHYEVDRWLKEGDRIYLDDLDKRNETSLEIIEAPGHTPDSIAVYNHAEKLLFVGDNIYPYTVIHLDCIGSNVKDYVQTLRKLQAFIEKVAKRDGSELKGKKEGEVVCQPCEASEGGKRGGEESGAASGAKKKADGPAKEAKRDVGAKPKVGVGTEKKTEGAADSDKKSGGPAQTEAQKPKPQPPKPAPHPHQKLIDDFCALTGMDRATMDATFSIDALMQICNHNVNEMLDMYFSNGAGLSMICPVGSGKPPTSSRGASGSENKSSARPDAKKEFKMPAEVKMCCGHVSAELGTESIGQLLTLLEAVRAGAMVPSHVDSGYGEYTNGTFSIMMRMQPKWE